MTQPKFAPIAVEDEVRSAYKLEPPLPWTLHRPGEFSQTEHEGRGRGTPGPDQGYALHLAARLSDRVVLAHGEHLDDALAGAVAVALRRSALYGRAPISADIEVALGLFGYLDPAPPELVGARKRLFSGCAHDYWIRRALADMVPEDILRLSPHAARGRAFGQDGAPTS